MTKATDATAVTLCCAREDSEYLRPVAELLGEEGTPTTLLAGVGDEPHLLGAALDAAEDERAFVICMSECLGRRSSRRVAGIFNARRGPSHYLAEIVVEPDEVEVMADSVRAMLEALELTRAPKLAAASGDLPRRGAGVATALRREASGPQVAAAAQPDDDERRPPSREQSVSGVYAISLNLVERVGPTTRAAPTPRQDPEPAPAPANTGEAHYPMEIDDREGSGSAGEYSISGTYDRPVQLERIDMSRAPELARRPGPEGSEDEATELDDASVAPEPAAELRSKRLLIAATLALVVAILSTAIVLALST